MGMKAAGNMNTLMNFSGNNNAIGSFANSKIKVEPKLAAIFSIAKKSLKYSIKPVIWLIGVKFRTLGLITSVLHNHFFGD